jgi:hypothetical protein
MTWFLVFTATVIADIVWAEWAKAIAARHAEKSAFYAAGIIVCSTFVTAEAVKDLWLLIPACAGGAAGTWWSVKRQGS